MKEEFEQQNSERNNQISVKSGSRLPKGTLNVRSTNG